MDKTDRINELCNTDFFQNYEKIEGDRSYVDTEKGRTLLYPLIGCGCIDRIHWWSEFYIGCSHDCKYCFVKLNSLKYKIIKDKSEWKIPRLKYSISEIIDIFQKELSKVKENQTIMHSMTSDPFMYQHNESKELHLRIAEIVNEHNIKNRFLTKGIYPEIELDKSLNKFGVSVTNLKEEYVRKLEPCTPIQKDRISSLFKIHKKGYFTFANITCFPFCSSIRDIDRLLNQISFVDEISFHGLYYFGHPTDEELQYYYEVSSRVYEYMDKGNKSFYTTGQLNPYVRLMENLNYN